VLRRRGGALLLLVVAVHAQCRRSGPSLVPRGESLTAATSDTSLETRGEHAGKASAEQELGGSRGGGGGAVRRNARHGRGARRWQERR
jgi:hypothetical protein